MTDLVILLVLQCNLVCVCCSFAGLLKTHNLSFQDSESLQAVFDKDSYGNVFRCNPRSVKKKEKRKNQHPLEINS